jgi:hypothetical protein
LQLHYATPQRHPYGYSHADPPKPHQPSWVARASYQRFQRGDGRIAGIVPHGNRLTFDDLDEKRFRYFDLPRETGERGIRSRSLARLKPVGDVTETLLRTGPLIRDGCLYAASAFLQALRQLRICAVFERDQIPYDQREK